MLASDVYDRRDWTIADLSLQIRKREDGSYQYNAWSAAHAHGSMGVTDTLEQALLHMLCAAREVSKSRPMITSRTDAWEQIEGMIWDATHNDADQDDNS